MSHFRSLSMALIALTIAQGASAAMINWSPAQNTASPTDIARDGFLVEAVNGVNSNTGSAVVNGVHFRNSDMLLGNSAGVNFLDGTDTGDPGLNQLLGSLDFGGGTSTAISIGGDLLQPGRDYEVQVFFTDLRGCCNGRTMTFGDGQGNSVDVNAGTGGLGQHARGTFTADAPSQQFTLITNGFGNAHINAYQIRDLRELSTVTLIDDDFNDGNIDTGGINGGFHLVTNGAGGTPSVLEASSFASIMTVGGNDNTGIVSNNAFDAASLSEGFSMTFLVAGVSGDPQSNGMFLGIQDDATSFFRNGGSGPDDRNFGLVFSGNESRTSSGNGFGLVTNDNGGPGSTGNGIVFDNGDLELISLQDGFQATITATPTGWRYEILGTNDTTGLPAIFEGEGTWVGSGLAPTFYTDFFDNEEFLAAYTQQGGQSLLLGIDRITLQALTESGGVPEPATATMLLLGAAGLMRRRRRVVGDRS